MYVGCRRQRWSHCWLLTSVFDRLKSRMGKGSFVRSVATLTLGTVVAQALALAAMPLLARLYTPADFGFLAVFVAISSVVGTAITLRYESAVLPAKTDQESATIVLICLVCIVAFGLPLMGASVLLPAGALRSLSAEGELAPWLPVAVLAGASIAIMATTQAWLNRQQRYGHMAGLRIAQSFTVVGLSLLFGTVFHYDQGLMLAHVLAYSVTAGIALWFVKSLARNWSNAEVKSAVKIHASAPKYLLPTAMLDVFTLQLPVVLIANWFGQDIAGQFSMAWRVLMLPMALIGAAMGQVFLQRFAQIYHQPKCARNLLTRAWRAQFLLSVGPMLVVTFFGESIFQRVLGAAWGEAGRMASFMAPMAMAVFISSPTSGTYIVLGLQRYSLLFGIFVLIYRPACIYIGFLKNDLMLGLAMTVIFEIIQITLYQSIVLKKLRTVE